MEKAQTKFFSIHNRKKLEDKEFSIIRGNIENTLDKVEIAKSIYPDEDWYFEFHNYKHKMNWTN
jgi:hypothetical protein